MDFSLIGKKRGELVIISARAHLVRVSDVYTRVRRAALESGRRQIVIGPLASRRRRPRRYV